uniref:DNA-directed RNA polymerase III subunit RPC6 n=1 Tax=Anthurium amnicola TaxID=1678845 RepID=A0A1D1Y248_9ARAE
MGRRPAAAAPPAKRPGTGAGTRDPRLAQLSETERKVYEVVWGKGDMGMWTADLKAETALPTTLVTKTLRSLHAKGLTKDVVNHRNRGRKMVMAAEFQPSKEISGGSWYADGSLDVEFIGVLRRFCRRSVEAAPGGVTTAEAIAGAVRDSGVFKMECSVQQIGEIMGALVLDGEVVELVSTGKGEFTGLPPGKKCYRCPRDGGGRPKVGAFASIPCGVCPRIAECTPDGIISPKNCVYYDKWLGNIEF